MKIYAHSCMHSHMPMHIGNVHFLSRSLSPVVQFGCEQCAIEPTLRTYEIYISRRRTTTSGAILFYSSLRAPLSLFLLSRIVVIAPALIYVYCTHTLGTKTSIYTLSFRRRRSFFIFICLVCVAGTMLMLFFFFCVHLVLFWFLHFFFIPQPRSKLKGGPMCDARKRIRPVCSLQTGLCIHVWLKYKND